MTKPNSFTVLSALTEAKKILAVVSETSSLDAHVLLAYITGGNRAWVVAHYEDFLSFEQIDRFEEALSRLKNGEPLPYVLGEWEFYGLPFRISPEVLIPRPETELLVEKAINWLKGKNKVSHVADAGTGSGIIPICIAKNIDDIEVTAIDISGEAIKIAKKNIEWHDLTERINLIQNDLLKGIEIKFDLITANLPYIPTETLKELAVYKTEPTLALDGGDDGLDLIRKLLEQSVHYLNPGGIILLEIEYRQGKKVIDMAKSYFPQAKITIHPDLAGHDRLVEIQT
ncbi:MAG: peptide chain release factor N(5)-glutamine methyltransferase [Chloroflexi bacterium]|jgi:release factor glutamine methyltransferase|nr:peptide chain release factor N(5)-glutamine methyltransferase [Chloroflexota bacterium]MBT3670992.1 peptide chain release factor N(5)-glutamine methyltransferase [Chloroflexota bacterium]MBT4003197.1 peptide chain release factor N(5)-glutamine methyltransferase [Chloroflexota bacterium]MBT4305025.1 peptide chain release factor N(5)-glutamine methyltransferase [Chloroflexota bacterium]MBT4533836.1 peptide chain release factor N(5)-glutamine methyltransferase [Chloroflexota bacterium]